MEANLEAIQLLGDARDEIKRLQRSNEIMSAQLEIVNVFRAMLFGPPQSMPMIQSVSSRIDRFLTGLK